MFMKIKFPCRSINDSDEPTDSIEYGYRSYQRVEIK